MPKFSYFCLSNGEIISSRFMTRLFLRLGEEKNIDIALAMVSIFDEA